MAKNPNPYVCDECGVPKTPSNNWFILISSSSIKIEKWADDTAETEGVKHLCGIQCTLKAAGKELAKIYGT